VRIFLLPCSDGRFPGAPELAICHTVIIVEALKGIFLRYGWIKCLSLVWR